MSNIAYPPTAESITPAATTYPYWEDVGSTYSRYIVSPKIPYGDVLQHPSGWWRWRCGCSGGDGHPTCSIQFIGYNYTLPEVKAYLQQHLLSEHYIVPPP